MFNNEHPCFFVIYTQEQTANQIFNLQNYVKGIIKNVRVKNISSL